MSVFQLVVNLAIAIVACLVINYLFSKVAFEGEWIVNLIFCLVAIYLTFSRNAAAGLRVR